MSNASKDIAQTDGHTHTYTHTHTHTHTHTMKTLPLLHMWEVTRMPFSQRPTSHLPIESQTLSI